MSIGEALLILVVVAYEDDEGERSSCKLGPLKRRGRGGSGAHATRKRVSALSLTIACAPRSIGLVVMLPLLIGVESLSYT